MTREELHGQVWSQPMRTLAKSMGISDVALAKRCRVANIPVPPRGWWARREAGKAVKVTPLPPAPFVLANYFPAVEESGDIHQGGQDGQGPDQAFPGPPVFRDIALVRDEIRAAVGTIKVSTDLNAPHAAVARLLRQDAERKPGTSYYERNAKKFASPIQQRRLRILSSIFRELERLGCKVSGATHAGERFSINVGGCWIYILFGIEGGPDATYFHRDRKSPKATDRPQLRFDLVEHDDRNPPLQLWREDEAPLERQAAEIVRGLLIRTEEETRRFALQHHKWMREDHERKQAEAKRVAEQVEAARLAKERANALARVEALIAGADALERAARIRRYVIAVKAACAGVGSTAQAAGLDRWAAWALAQADLVDPIVSGAFLSDLEL
jgi:hypothetical protein